MNSALFSLIDSFPESSVMVIGDSILDSYLSGRPQNLCREAPVAAVTVTQRRDSPGGAANTAVNAAALGARVQLLSVVGDDPEGTALCGLLEKQGIDTRFVIRSAHRKTLVKSRLVASSQMVARFDQGSTSLMPQEPENRLIGAIHDLFARSDAVIVSDYGYGVFTPRVISFLADLQASLPKTLVADSRALPRLRALSPTAVKPNYEETVSLLGINLQSKPEKRAGQIMTYGNRLLSLTGARVCAVTLDRDGALIFEKNNPPYRTYARSVSDIRATGAGDTFTAAFALGLCAAANTTAAAELASAAAGIVTAKEITSSCSADELKASISAGTKYIPDSACLSSLCAFYRAQGRRIVFTNGCFDILHRGHIAHLNRSKRLGDTLIVGVNSDAGVSRLKGGGRPINRLEDRIHILSALSCIDHIAVFEENTAESLVRAIRPHVFTKGGNYSRSSIPETSLLESMGAEITILPYLDDYSTAGILRHVRETG